MFYKELRDYLAPKVGIENAQSLSFIINAVFYIAMMSLFAAVMEWFFG